MPRKEFHVVLNSDGLWDSKKKNVQRASNRFETKQDAMTWSKEKAKQEGGELIPHKTDGPNQNPNSYGNDPCPPKGKKQGAQ